MNCIEKQKRINATQVKNTTKTKQNSIHRKIPHKNTYIHKFKRTDHTQINNEQLFANNFKFNLIKVLEA